MTVKKIKNPNTGDYFILLDEGDPLWTIMTASEIESSFQDSRSSCAMKELENQIQRLQETVDAQDERLCQSQLKEGQLKQQFRLSDIHRKTLELKINRFKKIIRKLQISLIISTAIISLLVIYLFA
tara:strand:+ start:51 stop:428 length:378 start_codon:yes stop_codon:yes gene_type:complete